MHYSREFKSNSPNGVRLQHVEKLLIRSRIIKNDESTQEFPTENEGVRKECSADEVGLLQLI